MNGIETDGVFRRLTGDHAATATAIAKELRIVEPDAPKGAIMHVRWFGRFVDFMLTFRSLGH